MARYILPHFGQLDSENVDEYYDTTIKLHDSDIRVDLNFESSSIETSRLEIARRFIEQIADFDYKNKKYIEQDFKDKDADTVKTYIEHHLDELGDDELNELIDASNKKLSRQEQLLKKLQLVRMGLYPDSEEQFAIFDYSIGEEITQYLVVLFVDEFGNLDYITMES